jgi:tetratricopeptide (TPR) repeat protein
MSRFSNLDFEEAPKVGAAPAAAEKWPNMDAPGCMERAREHFSRGEYEPALTFYSKALRFERDLREAWAGQIRCLLFLGEFPEAVTWSTRALERFPKAPDLLALKGLALVYFGDGKQGLEFLDGAVQERSPDALVWLCRGEGLLLVDDKMDRDSKANAFRCFLKAQELAPKDSDLFLRCGMALHRHGEAARARPILLETLNMAPHNPLVLYELGLCLEKLGERAAAGGYFARAVAQKPTFLVAREAQQRVQKRGLFDFFKGK